MKTRAKETLSINLHSEKYIRILQMLETQFKRNRKENSLLYHSSLHPFSMTPLYGHNSHHLPVLYISRHDHVILLHLYTPLLPVVPQTLNQLSSTLNTVQKHMTVCLSVSNIIVVWQHIYFLTEFSSDGITSHRQTFDLSSWYHISPSLLQIKILSHSRDIL